MSRFLLLLPIALSCGCTSLGLNAVSLGLKPRFVESSPENPVMEIVCLWEAGEGPGLENLPGRGFAGQLLFFTNGSPQPAKVNGDIRIYVFDDVGTPEEQAKPIYQFDSVDGAWNTYLRETNVGAAYQIFIPYTRKGRHAANCSLRVRYTPAEGGPPVYSKLATVPLPGRRRASDQEAASDAAPVAKREPTPLETAEISRSTTLDLRSLSQALSKAAYSSESHDASSAAVRHASLEDASVDDRASTSWDDDAAAEPRRLSAPADAKLLDDADSGSSRRYRLNR